MAEVGWPHEEDGEELPYALTPAPPTEHAHPITDVTGLTTSLNQLQNRQASQLDEMRALWDVTRDHGNSLWVLYLLVFGLAIAVIALVATR